MTPTHVIILAQGAQGRMGDLVYPKQVLPLPAHFASTVRNCRILDRTIAQVVRILSGSVATPDEAQRAMAPHGIVVIGSRRLREHFAPRGDFLLMQNESHERVYFGVSAEVYTLHDPGNSSLLGLARVLDARSREPGAVRERTVVLLGDVVYSWACLEKLFRPEDSGNVTICGTPDLDQERGELWGVSWYKSADNFISDAIDYALSTASKHEDAYQPGQLRQLLFAVDYLNLGPPRCNYSRDWWCPIDDYTMDVDLPEHLIDLARSSLQALADDKEHDLG